jgi:hypothetical protein
MGRPIGSVNREKPFTDMLGLALLSGGGRRLRIIAEKLARPSKATYFARSRIDWTASHRARRCRNTCALRPRTVRYHSERIRRTDKRAKLRKNLRSGSGKVKALAAWSAWGLIWGPASIAWRISQINQYDQRVLWRCGQSYANRSPHQTYGN